jgi:hypothetical protein
MGAVNRRKCEVSGRCEMAVLRVVPFSCRNAIYLMAEYQGYYFKKGYIYNMKTIQILLVEDNPADIYLAKEALKESTFPSSCT